MLVGRQCPVLREVPGETVRADQQYCFASPTTSIALPVQQQEQVMLKIGKKMVNASSRYS
jgi:hypothetical protein